MIMIMLAAVVSLPLYGCSSGKSTEVPDGADHRRALVFGRSDLVAQHVTAFIKGMDSAKISTALKHFPGHGNVGEDSHTHLPCSDFSLEEIKACDLIPFQAGIDAGSDMIMTAHIQFPKIEKKTYVSIKDGEVSFLDEYLYERGFGIKEW